MKKVSAAKTNDTYVTMAVFEKTMTSIATTLNENTALTKKMLESMNNISEDNREYRRRALENDITLIGHDRKIEDLIVRVEKLEAKVK